MDMKILSFVAVLATVTCFGHPGIGIVQDSGGNIFYTDLTHVWKIDLQGKKTIAVRSVHTHELYMDDKDNLFGEHLWYNGEAANTWGHYVWRLKADGKLDKIIPNTTGFREDFSFVRDHQGRTYEAQGPAGCQHIKRTSTDNRETKLGDKCLTNIRWMTADAGGTLYLVDGGDVKRVDEAGCVSTLAESLPQARLSQFFVNKDHYLGGLAVDADQNIYVCDFSARNVKKIKKDGQVIVVAATNIPWSPSGILVEEDGDLWVLQYSITNEARVEKVEVSGKRIIF